MTEYVARWQFAVFCTVWLVVAGLGLGEPALLLAGIVPLGYVAYGYTSRPPTATLTVSRTVETETPTPGSTVGVTLTVTNEGDDVVPDLRVVDGVPGPLPVVSGSARGGFALLPGETVTLEYEIRARRGVYQFDAVRWRVRSVQGGHVDTTTQTPDGDTQVRCLDTIESFPLLRQTRQYTGTTAADEGGEGVEFYGSREHHPTDPARRIDWNRFASTGELTTLIHREERAQQTVFLLDASEASRVGGGEGTYTGTELGAYAIERGAHALLADNDSVGLAILGTGVEDRPAFVAPGGGDVTLDRIRHALAGVGAFVADALSAEPSPDDGGTDGPPTDAATEDSPSLSDRSSTSVDSRRQLSGLGESDAAAPSYVSDNPRRQTASVSIEEVLAQTTAATQFVVVSPLLDDDALTTVDTLVEQQRSVSVLSPAVIRGESVGARVEQLDRVRRIRTIEQRGVPVVDWDAEEPLLDALVRNTGRRNGTTLLARNGTQAATDATADAEPASEQEPTEVSSDA